MTTANDFNSLNCNASLITDIHIYIYIYVCIIYHTKQVYIQKYRPEVGVQGCDIARGPQAQGLYHIRGHPPKVYIFCILTGFSMLYRIYFIMMTAFLNGRYIYKNINPTTSKDDVIIMRYIYIYNTG